MIRLISLVFALAVATSAQAMPVKPLHLPSRETKDAANIAGVLTEDEARRIAAHIAKLPVLLGQARPEDVLRPRAISRMSVMRPKTPRPRTSHRAREGGA